MSNHYVEFDYNLNEENGDRLKTVYLDGDHHKLMLDNLILNRGKQTAAHIDTNAKKAAAFFADTKKETSRSKILCLGKVQSGKTAFFISSIALAFDNGYDICFLFGGTKNNLLDQNIDRISNEFSNNDNVRIIILKESNYEEILDLIKKGNKVIVVVLKNVSSKNSNLFVALDFANYFKKIPTLIIDDESDEHTPGAPKRKKSNPRAGITHDVISDIVYSFNNITIMFVTATPQANMLLSTLDELSPDYAVLVEPGDAYTGGEAYHDLLTNEHVVKIDDADDFKLSIPESYKKALKYFLLATTILEHSGLKQPFSMLIHPSHLKKVHKNIVEKISEDLNDLINILIHPQNITYDLIESEFKKIYREEFRYQVPFNIIMANLRCHLEKYRIYEYNTSLDGKNDIEDSKTDSSILYKIFVGGNMLGRGVTIPNLIVTYMYRDSKVSAVDTLYQRARWFGYKRDFFDFCRVYMTQNLKEKFVAIADNERDLWTSVSEFLETNINFKKFKRIFALDHEKLILTRTSVSKTITFQRIKSGYTYDKSVLFRDGDIDSNNKLVMGLLNNYSYKSEVVSYAKNDTQNHYIITTEYSLFYENFISKFRFQRNSSIGPIPFLKILKQVQQGILENTIKVAILRYKIGEFRSLSPQGNSIKELPQGYDHGTGYPGDKNLPNLENKLHLQIHLVYTDKSKREIIPILAFNNPITKHSIRYVTGDEFLYDI